MDRDIEDLMQAREKLHQAIELLEDVDRRTDLRQVRSYTVGNIKAFLNKERQPGNVNKLLGRLIEMKYSKGEITEKEAEKMLKKLPRWARPEVSQSITDGLI